MAKSLPLRTPAIRKLLKKSISKLPKRAWEWNKTTPKLPPLTGKVKNKEYAYIRGHAYELLCLVNLAHKLRANKLDVRLDGGDILHFNQSPADLDITRSYLVVYRGIAPIGLLATDVVFHRASVSSVPDPHHLDQHEVDVTFCIPTNGPDKKNKVKVLDSDLVISLFCKNKPWSKTDFREFMGFVRVQGWEQGHSNVAAMKLRGLLHNILGPMNNSDPYMWLLAPISGFASPTIETPGPVDIPGEQTTHLLKIR